MDDALCLPLLSLPGELPLLFRPPQVFRPLEVCIVATKDVGYSRMYIPRTQFKEKPNTLRLSTSARTSFKGDRWLGKPSDAVSAVTE